MKKKDKSPIANWTYEELVDYVTREAMDALITKGGAGLKGVIYIWLSQAMRWNEENK